VDAKKGERLIISAADKGYWDYYYEIGQYYTQEGSLFGVRGAELEASKSKLECWPLTKPLPVDFQCDSCTTSMHTKPELIQQCATAHDSSSFQAINKRVVDAGGKCKVASDFSFRRKIDRCSSSRIHDLSDPVTVYSACMLDQRRISKVESDIAALEEKAKQILEKDQLLDNLVEQASPDAPAVKKSKMASPGAGNTGPMLLCTSEQTGKRIFISEDEKSYWDYRYEKSQLFAETAKRLPSWHPFYWSAEDFAKFTDKLDCHGIPMQSLEDLKCDECQSNSMPSQEHIEQCAAAETVEDLLGGNCLFRGTKSFLNAVTECVKVVFAMDVSSDSEARGKLAQIGAWLPANVDDADVEKVVAKLQDAKERKTSCPIALDEFFEGDHMATSDGGLAAVKSKKNGHIHLFFLNSIVRAMQTNPTHPETREPLTADMIWPLTEGAAAIANAKEDASACIMESHAEKREAYQQVLNNLGAKKSEVSQLKTNAELYYA
jgi:hypothetical protein